MPKSHLFMFYGTECPHCHEMMPLISQLKKEEKIAVESLEVWHNDKNAKLMKQYDKDFCGGVPFFYNTVSKKWICGATDYETLKNWGVDKIK